MGLVMREICVPRVVQMLLPIDCVEALQCGENAANVEIVSNAHRQSMGVHWSAYNDQIGANQPTC